MKNEKQMFFFEYYQLVFFKLHKSFFDQLKKRYVTETIDIRRKFTKDLRETDMQYDSLYCLLENIEKEIHLTISRRSAFYWLHICRRIAPLLEDSLGDRTDAAVAFEVRSVVEMAIFKFGSLTNKYGFADSSKVKFNQILSGMLNKYLSKLNPYLLKYYKQILRKKPQIVLTDFSKKDLVDLYYIYGLSYQYWYVSAKLRSFGKGVKIKVLENGDLQECRSTEQNYLINLFDERTKQNSLVNGFVTNVGTFVATEEKNDIDTNEQIITAAANVEQLNAKQLEIDWLNEDWVPNYLVYSFNSINFYTSHKYLSASFEEKHQFGLLELCQISSYISKVLIFSKSVTSKELNEKIIFHNLHQRAYRIFNETLTDLKSSIKEYFTNEIKTNNLQKSQVVNQVDIIIDFLTLNKGKQSLIGLWSGGPSHPLIDLGDSYIYDMSSWFSFFCNLFFGLKNYDINSQKGIGFEKVFNDLTISNSLNVVMHSFKIKYQDTTREVDVAIKVNNEILFIFECKAFERPLNFSIGNERVINSRIKKFKESLEQVDTLVSFIEKNKKGDNYDFSWAKQIYGVVVSPYTEWIWSLEQSLWIKIDDLQFPKIMSVTEAINQMGVLNAR